MIYQVLREIRVKTGQGEVSLPPGQIIRLQPAKANPLIELGKLKPAKPEPHAMTKARRQSLDDVIYAIILDAHSRIIKARQGQPYMSNDEIRKTEQDINRLQHEVMNGQAMLSDYQVACDRWVSMMIKA